MQTVGSLEEHTKVGNGREESDEQLLQDGADTTLSPTLIVKVEDSVEFNTQVEIVTIKDGRGCVKWSTKR